MHPFLQEIALIKNELIKAGVDYDYYEPSKDEEEVTFNPVPIVRTNTIKKRKTTIRPTKLAFDSPNEEFVATRILPSHEHAQLQTTLASNLYRHGIIGDGSCFFHAILHAISPNYRKYTESEADAYQKALTTSKKGAGKMIEAFMETFQDRRAELAIKLRALLSQKFAPEKFKECKYLYTLKEYYCSSILPIKYLCFITPTLITLKAVFHCF